MVLPRISLPDRVREVLREGIVAGRWGAELPSEIELCREFQVSRVTLRKALSWLVQENLLGSGRRGRRHAINRPALASGSPGTARIIRALTPFAPSAVGSVNNAILDGAREKLSAAGYHLEVERHPKLFRRHVPAELKRLSSLPETAGWLLFASNTSQQEWFAANPQPCVVLGSLYPGVALSSIKIDRTAAMRHAANLLCTHGHRECVYLLAELASLNGRIAAEAFVNEVRRRGAKASVIVHDGTRQALCRILEGLMLGRPRPTAFVAYNAEHCVAVLCYLLNARYRVPQDASVISGWDDVCLSFTVPAMTRYAVDGRKIGAKAGRSCSTC